MDMRAPSAPWESTWLGTVEPLEPLESVERQEHPGLSNNQEPGLDWLLVQDEETPGRHRHRDRSRDHRQSPPLSGLLPEACSTPHFGGGGLAV